MKLQKPSSLFWSWGAYVFLPINIIIGTIISSSGASIEELIISLFMALFIMMILAYPAVCLSSIYEKNYSQSVRCFLKNRRVAVFFIFLVPLISVGWYAIQTTMFVKLIQPYIGEKPYIFALLVIGMSYIFALGVTKFEYSWLKNAGIVGMLFLIIMFATNIIIRNSDIKHGTIRINCVLDYTIQILGTWIFSSVTCIMDITSHIKERKKGFKYIILATFLTNILLIALGVIDVRADPRHALPHISKCVRVIILYADDFTTLQAALFHIAGISIKIIHKACCRYLFAQLII